MLNHEYQQTANKWLTSDIDFLEPWPRIWYEYVSFIASCTHNMHDLESDRWPFDEVVDHVKIYGAKAAEGFSAFNVGLFITYK